MNNDQDFIKYIKKRQRDEAQAEEDKSPDGMFFGPSPKEKKDLRQTVDPRKINLKDLDLNAIDRDKYNAPAKVGKSLRLIDVAMSDSGPQKALTREEAAQRSKTAHHRRDAQAARARAQADARAKAQAAARAKAQAAARAKAQAAARAKAKAAARAKAQSNSRAQAQARAAAKAHAEAARKKRELAKAKGVKKTKGIHISDLGLTVHPRKRTPSGRVKRGGPRR